MQKNADFMLDAAVSEIKSNPSSAIEILENFFDEHQFSSLNVKQKKKTVEAVTSAARELLSANNPDEALAVSRYIWEKSDNSGDDEKSLMIIPDIALAYAVAGKYGKAAEILQSAYYDAYDGGSVRLSVLSSCVKVGIICFGADGDADTAAKIFEFQYNLSKDGTEEEKIAKRMLDDIKAGSLENSFSEVCKEMSDVWENENHIISNPFKRFCV